jgi:hypothetical protein
MNKVQLSLASFVLGVCCASLASSFIHASTHAQEKPHGPGVLSAGAEPVVPPIQFNASSLISLLTSGVIGALVFVFLMAILHVSVIILCCFGLGIRDPWTWYKQSSMRAQKRAYERAGGG